MSEIANQNLSGVSETLLLPLYIRAMESQRPDALIKDDKAVAFLERQWNEWATTYPQSNLRFWRRLVEYRGTGRPAGS